MRQLWDWKASAQVEAMDARGLTAYAEICGMTLAHAHARGGDRIAIAAYLGKGEAFDRAMAAFAEAYADQSERDYAALQAAVDSGRIEAEAPRPKAAEPFATVFGGKVTTRFELAVVQSSSWRWPIVQAWNQTRPTRTMPKLTKGGSQPAGRAIARAATTTASAASRKPTSTGRISDQPVICPDGIRSYLTRG